MAPPDIDLNALLDDCNVGAKEEILDLMVGEGDAEDEDISDLNVGGEEDENFDLSTGNVSLFQFSSISLLVSQPFVNLLVPMGNCFFIPIRCCRRNATTIRPKLNAGRRSCCCRRRCTT